MINDLCAQYNAESSAKNLLYILFFFPSVPRSCPEWYSRGMTLSGIYQIDPDGMEGLPPFDVYCDMSQAPPTAVLHHDGEDRHHVSGFEEPGSYTQTFNYTGIHQYIEPMDCLHLIGYNT